MLFTVELRGYLSCRLCKDTNWRHLGEEALKVEDFRTSNPAEVDALTPRSGTIIVDGEAVVVRDSRGALGKSLYGTSRVFRVNFPAVPTRQQLVGTIATGDDAKHNVLVLNFNGIFELRQRPPFDKNRIDPTIVARYETFAAGNDYVGINAASDSRHLDIAYEGLLQSWVSHLRSGRTQAYVDSLATTPLAQMIDEIEQIRLHWHPQYSISAA